MYSRAVGTTTAVYLIIRSRHSKVRRKQNTFGARIWISATSTEFHTVKVLCVRWCARAHLARDFVYAHSLWRAHIKARNLQPACLRWLLQRDTALIAPQSSKAHIASSLCAKQSARDIWWPIDYIKFIYWIHLVCFGINSNALYGQFQCNHKNW